MIDEILQRFDLKYEDLNSAEKETLDMWMVSLEKNTLTIEKIREYIVSMRHSVELELSQTTHNNKQDIFLKARMRNYLLLEAFLQTPDKARQAIERSLASIIKK